jgi:hypothetical protein
VLLGLLFFLPHSRTEHGEPVWQTRFRPFGSWSCIEGQRWPGTATTVAASRLASYTGLALPGGRPQLGGRRAAPLPVGTGVGGRALEVGGCRRDSARRRDVAMLRPDVELQPAGGGVREDSRVSRVTINGWGTRTYHDRTADIVNLPDQTPLDLTGDKDPLPGLGIFPVS